MPAPARTAVCPSRDVLAAFSIGDVAEDTMSSVADHVAGCPDCQSVLDATGDTPDGLLSSLKGLRGQAVVNDTCLDRDMAAVEARSSFSATPPLAIPQQLREYQLLAKLGQGGMGSVYKALHTRLDRVVAVKLLAPSRTGDANAAARFQREMKAVGKLEHPHIVRATDAGEADGTAFLVMEYVEGADLARLSKRLGPLPVADACELVRQAALGLQHAHEHGLTHRDVKPSNLILTTAGQVKVLDLGLALLAGIHPASEDATSANLVLGSFDYMAPEQADNPHHVDHRADLYGLGCTLYHLLTGQAPYPAPTYETPLQKMKAHATLPPPSLRKFRPEAAAVAPILDRLLAKDPSRRYASAADAAEALKPFTVRANLARLLAAKPEAPPRRPASRKRSPNGLIGAVVALMFAVVLVAAAVVYVQTEKGLIEIVTDDDDVKVSVERGGKEITVLDKKTNQQAVLQTGEYQLRIVEGGKERALDRNTFTLKRGDKEVVTVRRVGPAGPGTNPPLLDAWLQKVADLPAGEKVREVMAELRRRNPDYDGQPIVNIVQEEVRGLDFCTDHVSDLSPLRALTNLLSLVCWGSEPGKGKLADLTPLRGLPLVRFDGRCNPVADLTPLQDMKLDLLVCHETRVTSLAVVKGMALVHLNCRNTKVADLTPLAGQPLLYLLIDNTMVEDLGPLRHVPSLVDLSCGNTAVKSLEPLRNLQLKALDCAFSRVADLAPLAGQPLVQFQCSGTKITSLAALKDMRTLTNLSCYLTDVADLSPLQGLPINYLDAGDTKIADLAPLKGMPLTHLFIGNTKVADVQPLRGMALEALSLDPGRADADFLRSLPKLARFNAKPIAEVLKELDAKKP